MEEFVKAKKKKKESEKENNDKGLRWWAKSGIERFH